MKAFMITVVGIVIGLAASLANIMWLAVLVALIALAGAYTQYRDATAFEFTFHFMTDEIGPSMESITYADDSVIK